MNDPKLLEMACYCKLAYYDDINEDVIKEVEFIGDTKLNLIYNKIKIEKHGQVAWTFETPDMNVVAFRGTDDVNDWLYNLDSITKKTVGARVHKGFNDALNNILFNIQLPENGKDLYICGHSLGGAMATLFAWKTLLVISGIYTFGQPRCIFFTSAHKYNRKFKNKHFRTVNGNDIVTHVPTLPLYRHIGKKIKTNYPSKKWYDFSKDITAHDIDHYINNL